ncbi:adenosine deaminase [Haemophilus paracuniculus]|uniref:adenosine deaminase n=1 Tax=Haemophilus paracuniculus TaxID=734 RepID=A0A1T0AQ58_9PAST|nr:adenosine deaminase [Haemophilus paracuniculus]OOR98241.1 adenosine deaminase [Haemophilus paracuniculus]
MDSLTQYALIDLHLHLDGSLSPEWILTTARQQNIPLPADNVADLLRHIAAPQDCTSLNDYLQCFAIPVRMLQTAENLASATADLVKRLDASGLIYAEIRFAPQLHTQQGLTQRQAVEAVLAGVQQTLPHTAMFGVNVILCCMRGEHNQAENVQTVQLAKDFLGKGVVATDLAGAEAIYPTAQFASLFELANQLGVPFTLHAGEADGAESVKSALDFGAKRIGHGVRASEDPNLLARLKAEKTTLEMCPCSNLQTKTVRLLADYPLRHFLQQGIKATLNTDNMTVSQTTLASEFRLLSQGYVLTHPEAKQLLTNAIDGAFLSEQEKRELRERVAQRLAQYVA